MAGQERNSFSEAVRVTIHMRSLPNVRQGGYNSPNAARAWAFLTSVVVGDLAIGNVDLVTLVPGWQTTLSRCRDSRPSRIPFVSTFVYAGRPCWQHARPELGRILAAHRRRLWEGSNRNATATIRRNSAIVPDQHLDSIHR